MLRDASDPRRTLKLSDRAENLEAIELRLKDDILAEANRYAYHYPDLTPEYTYLKTRFGGLILTHNELGELPQQNDKHSYICE